MIYNADLGVHVNNGGLIDNGPGRLETLKTVGKYVIGIVVPAWIGYHIGDSIANRLIEANDAAYQLLRANDNNMLLDFIPDFSHVAENTSIQVRSIGTATGLGGLVGLIGTRLVRNHNLRNKV